MSRAAAACTLTTLSAIAFAGALASAPSSEHRRVAPTDRTAGALARLAPVHRDMIERILRGDIEDAGAGAPCFAEGTDAEIVAIFESAMARAAGDRYNQVLRWGATALGPAGAQGDPIVLTWSIVPDGTPVPSGAGENPGFSNLNNFLNGIYGSRAVWEPLYAQMFARWSELTGITYVYEPNDDGSPLFASDGQAGVRGDLRMAGKPIDGFQNIAAYNFYPAAGGDMVIDTSDALYTFTGSNSLLLRNVLTHEHGHGMGQNHVCPGNQTKIMEPATPLAFDGPDHDAIRSAHRHYGDPYEPDNSAPLATDLGSFGTGSDLLIGPTPEPVVPLTSVLSIDANSEQDWFRFSVPATQRVTVTVTPVGLTYDDSDQACSAQPFSCCSGSFTDSRRIADLAVQLIDTNGSTVIAGSSAAGLGLAESVQEAELAQAGAFFVRVYETNLPLEAQMYTLRIEVLPAVSPAPCPGDANADRVIDFNDIVAALGHWLADYAPDTGPGDANLDGTVDFQDITAVLSNWLQPCP